MSPVLRGDWEIGGPREATLSLSNSFISLVGVTSNGGSFVVVDSEKMKFTFLNDRQSQVK